jgi:hypothetical protein
MKFSNNTLVVLLSFAILISVFGTWTSLSYMDSLDLLTGRATDTGTTSLTVTGVTSCTATDNTIAFGTMVRDISNDSSTTGDYITIENNGNTQINITAYSTAELWDDATYQTPSAYWQVNCNAVESGTCNSTYGDVPGSDGNLIAYLLNPDDATDVLTVGVNVTVPSDELSGAKSGTLTFNCVVGS